MLAELPLSLLLTSTLGVLTHWLTHAAPLLRDAAAGAAAACRNPAAAGVSGGGFGGVGAPLLPPSLGRLATFVGVLLLQVHS